MSVRQERRTVRYDMIKVTERLEGTWRGRIQRKSDGVMIVDLRKRVIERPPAEDVAAGGLGWIRLGGAMSDRAVVLTSFKSLNYSAFHTVPPENEHVPLYVLYTHARVGGGPGK